MKKIFFIKALSNQETKDNIINALDDTRANYNIDEKNNCVVVEGDNDVIRACKIAIQEAGYRVE